jgi:hypothetical protein
MFKIFQKKQEKPQQKDSFEMGHIGDDPNQKLMKDASGNMFVEQKEMFGKKRIDIHMKGEQNE